MTKLHGLYFPGETKTAEEAAAPQQIPGIGAAGAGSTRDPSLHPRLLGTRASKSVRDPGLRSQTARTIQSEGRSDMAGAAPFLAGITPGRAALGLGGLGLVKEMMSDDEDADPVGKALTWGAAGLGAGWLGRKFIADPMISKRMQEHLDAKGELPRAKAEGDQTFINSVRDGAAGAEAEHQKRRAATTDEKRPADSSQPAAKPTPPLPTTVQRPYGAIRDMGRDTELARNAAARPKRPLPVIQKGGGKVGLSSSLFGLYIPHFSTKEAMVGGHLAGNPGTYEALKRSIEDEESRKRKPPGPSVKPPKKTAQMGAAPAAPAPAAMPQSTVVSPPIAGQDPIQAMAVSPTPSQSVTTPTLSLQH